MQLSSVNRVMFKTTRRVSTSWRSGTGNARLGLDAVNRDKCRAGAHRVGTGTGRGGGVRYLITGT